MYRKKGRASETDRQEDIDRLRERERDRERQQEGGRGGNWSVSVFLLMPIIGKFCYLSLYPHKVKLLMYDSFFRPGATFSHKK